LELHLQGFRLTLFSHRHALLCSRSISLTIVDAIHDVILHIQEHGRSWIF
jgi:hypothetical protein